MTNLRVQVTNAPNKRNKPTKYEKDSSTRLGDCNIYLHMNMQNHDCHCQGTFKWVIIVDVSEHVLYETIRDFQPLVSKALVKIWSSKSSQSDENKVDLEVHVALLLWRILTKPSQM